jgi:hypothetical protein
MTATQTATLTKINNLNYAIERKLKSAVAMRDDAVARISAANTTLAFNIEKLIQSEAQLRVWSEIDRFINAHSEADKTADDTLARLLEYVGKYVTSEHKINSSSNVSVEIETEHRLEFARAYNFIADTARASY